MLHPSPWHLLVLVSLWVLTRPSSLSNKLVIVCYWIMRALFFNNNSNNNANIYSAVCHYGKTTARVHSVHSMNANWAPSSCQASDLGCESACRLPSSIPTVAIYCYYSVQRLILNFTVPQRVEGRVDIGGWLHTETTYMITDGHPSHY